VRAGTAPSGGGAVGAERDPQSFDRLAEEYDFAASLERRPDFFVDNLPARRRRALDVGCGTGILALELARHFESVLAVDVSEPMLAIARLRRLAPNVEYRRADAERLEVEGEFDAIVSHTTFHHLTDPRATLARLRRALAPAGRLLLVDNVARRPALPRHVFVIGALLGFPATLRDHGLRAAWRLLRFRLSRPWLEHLLSDRYLSEERFRALFGAELPGARFERMGVFMSLVWEAPAREA